MRQAYVGNIFLDVESYKYFVDGIAQVVFMDWQEAIATDEDFMRMDCSNIALLLNVIKNDVSERLTNSISEHLFGDDDEESEDK